MNQRFQCQVCDRIADPEMSFKDAEEIQLWTQHRIELLSAWVIVFTCPQCAELKLNEIFEGYQRRIKDGRDARYH
jgi:hypothetical protein